MRKLFSKDYEFDLEKRELLLKGMLKNNSMVHSESELTSIKQGKSLFRMFQSCKKTLTVKLKNELLHALCVQIEGTTWCKLNSTVRCAEKDGLAFLLNVECD